MRLRWSVSCNLHNPPYPQQPLVVSPYTKGGWGPCFLFINDYTSPKNKLWSGTNYLWDVASLGMGDQGHWHLLCQD